MVYVYVCGMDFLINHGTAAPRYGRSFNRISDALRNTARGEAQRRADEARAIETAAQAAQNRTNPVAVSAPAPTPFAQDTVKPKANPLYDPDAFTLPCLGVGAAATPRPPPPAFDSGLCKKDDPVCSRNTNMGFQTMDVEIAMDGQDPLGPDNGVESSEWLAQESLRGKHAMPKEGALARQMFEDTYKERVYEEMVNGPDDMIDVSYDMEAVYQKDRERRKIQRAREAALYAVENGGAVDHGPEWDVNHPEYIPMPEKEYDPYIQPEAPRVGPHPSQMTRAKMNTEGAGLIVDRCADNTTEVVTSRAIGYGYGLRTRAPDMDKIKDHIVVGDVASEVALPTSIMRRAAFERVAPTIATGDVATSADRLAQGDTGHTAEHLPDYAQDGIVMSMPDHGAHTASRYVERYQDDLGRDGAYYESVAKSVREVGASGDRMPTRIMDGYKDADTIAVRARNTGARRGGYNPAEVAHVIEDSVIGDAMVRTINSLERGRHNAEFYQQSAVHMDQTSDVNVAKSNIIERLRGLDAGRRERMELEVESDVALRAANEPSRRHTERHGMMGADRSVEDVVARSNVAEQYGMSRTGGDRLGKMAHDVPDAEVFRDTRHQLRDHDVERTRDLDFKMTESEVEIPRQRAAWEITEGVVRQHAEPTSMRVIRE